MSKVDFHDLKVLVSKRFDEMLSWGGTMFSSNASKAQQRAEHRRALEEALEDSIGC